jgi:hypothetical protein
MYFIQDQNNCGLTLGWRFPFKRGDYHIKISSFNYLLPYKTVREETWLSNVENQSSSFVPADTCKQTLSQSDDRVKKIQYAEFDESKWIPDEKCTSCRRKYLDPTPSHSCSDFVWHIFSSSIHVLSVLSTLILFACGSLPITSLSLSTASLHSPFLELGV